ncbi:MAG: cytochrome P450 [Aphanocapsa sp. GSE-SYN-MK-11-07L]|nr:cytochrome P450 [Aphanocapsa sp. GSE-SYN-MK-11-07L]
MKSIAGSKSPALVQLLEWIFNPLGYLQTNHQKFGDCFQMHFTGFPPFVMVSHPEMIEQIFTAPASQFDVGNSNFLLLPTLGENSLLLLDGDRHQRQRQLLMPPFHGERMRAYGQLICQITEQVIDQWQLDQPFTLRDSMQEISLQLIIEAVFGVREGDRVVQLKRLLQELIEAMTSVSGTVAMFFSSLQLDLGDWSPSGKLLRRRAQIDQLIFAEIAERRQTPNPDRTDILNLMMLAVDEAGQPMTDQELRDELMTLLIAGHETTATALTWSIYWIHRLPAVKDKLLQELASLPDHPDPSSIAKLSYLSAVCSETLRIYPIALMTQLRTVKAPFQCGNHLFPPGTILAGCIHLLHQRPDLYPDPEQFRPERFLERQFSAYEYIPFGGGNRRCIGAAFALFEMKLALATILSHCQLTLAETKPVLPKRRGLTMTAAGGVKMALSDRRSLPHLAPS